MVTFYTRLNQDQDNVFLSENQKVIKIMNRISSVDTVEFYSPVIGWMEELSKINSKEFLDLSIIYIDSNISTILHDINIISNLAIEKGIDIQFDWLSDNEDLQIGTSYIYSIQRLKLNLKIKAIA